jgi:hypothetical protein
MSAHHSHITDADILAVVRNFGNHTMTYIVRNLLAVRFPNVETPYVLRRLKRLEREGKVQRVGSPYVVQICWSAL